MWLGLRASLKCAQLLPFPLSLTRTQSWKLEAGEGDKEELSCALWRSAAGRVDFSVRNVFINDRFHMDPPRVRD